MRRVVVALVVGAAGLVVGCGVEVPDDVADDLRETSTTTDEAPATTEIPTSDDELEQALIDNGYTLAEAECGAENLRETLDEEEIGSIVGADTIEDISASTARAFAEALRPCVEDGAGAGGEDEGDDDAPMPGMGDDSEGDVSRSRFLAALISGGIADDEARCIVEGVYAELDQDDINILFHAEAESDVPDDVLDTFSDITDACR
ncbi:MAG TPA: hypothetical protein VF228_17830 [Iamia sp.]